MKTYPINQEALAREYKKDKKEKVSNSGQSKRFYFLKKGITQVRILPPYSEAGIWFREVQEHATTQDGSFQPEPCPRMVGESCVFCAEGQRLYSLKTEESIEAAKELRARNQYLFNALIYSSPEEGDKLDNGSVVLKTGVMVKRDILDLDQDAAGGWGDITNLEDGVEIRIEKRGEGRMGTHYITKGIPKRSSILEDLAAKKLDPEVTIKLVDLDAMYEPKDSETLKIIFDTMKSAEAGFTPTPLPNISSEAPPVPDIPAPETDIPYHSKRR